MSRSSPTDRLATALEIAAPRTKGGYVKIGTLARISSRQLANAMQGRPVATDAYLRLCVAIGFDPLPEIEHARVTEPRGFSTGTLALALSLRLRRALNKHNVRQAADAVGVKASTITRAEMGDTMSIGVVLKLCVYCGQHPYSYLEVPPENVSRGTQTNTPPRVGAAA